MAVVLVVSGTLGTVDPEKFLKAKLKFIGMNQDPSRQQHHCKQNTKKTAGVLKRGLLLLNLL